MIRPMAEELSALSLVLLGIFVVSFAVTLYLVLGYQRRTQKEIAELSGRLAELEREYIKIRPQMDELRGEVDDRVDYGTMEKKLKELISFVGEKVRGKK